ncbi:hypothetical protein [Archangium sp.]|uniref:hypothetical protein n=1 Tax=Archangium sp. TaxID=1872627 RepID=UPI002D725C5F|nr:hypothetical protein [Archangium sp.]HYO52522.1 hypothetical protein [Archangium sp.]
MQHELIRAPLHLWLSGLLLVACGGAPEALAPSEELLGTQETALCSGTSVTTLSIQGLSTYQGEMGGSGSWEVSYPANAVHLDYYVDGVLRASDERRSDTRSGTWNFSYSPVSCGSRTFEVKAYPMVIDSLGNTTRCPTSGPMTASRVVSEACPPTASLSCSFSSPIYSCTGSGSGGTAPLTPMWRDSIMSNGSTTWQVGQWFDGQWSEYFYCKPWSYSTRVEFRVRDANGVYSETWVSTCGSGGIEY